MRRLDLNAGLMVLVFALTFASASFAQKKDVIYFKTIVLECFKNNKVEETSNEAPNKPRVKELLRSSFRRALKESASHL